MLNSRFNTGKHPTSAMQNEGSLITLAMLIDSLKGYRIASTPTADRSFQRILLITNDLEIPDIVRKELGSFPLVVCRARHALPILEGNPSAFVLTILTKESIGPVLSEYRERCLVIESESTIEQIAFVIQAYFMKVSLWEAELEKILLRQGGIDEMLDASVAMIKNFIFVSDSSFNVIARTSAVEPPDELHRNIIQQGCLTTNAIAERRFRLPEKQFFTREASDITPFARISFPVHVNHSYCGSISMSCNAYPDTEGLRDLFRILLKYAIPTCLEHWNKDTEVMFPSFFFSKLIRHEQLEADYLDAQIKELSLDGAAHFKLIAMNEDMDENPERTLAVMQAASMLNDGHVRCFPYRNQILVLCYSAASADGRLSHRRSSLELREKIFKPFGTSSAVSSVFSNITDLDLAYRQTEMAFDFREAISHERFDTTANICDNVILFEDVLIYHLINQSMKDERFTRFIFDSSIANIVHQEDCRNGTNHLAILWLYLKNERNATAVANLLHMHRNTVLYHIEKIERRFDFDLSQKTARDWMLLSFKYLFLTLESESFEKIYGRSFMDRIPDANNFKQRPSANPLP